MFPELSENLSSDSDFEDRSENDEFFDSKSFFVNTNTNINQTFSSEFYPKTAINNQPPALNQTRIELTEELTYNTNSNTLCLLYQNNKLACAFFDFTKKCLFYLNDLPETTKFELTDLIIEDTWPFNVITSAKGDTKFIEFLKNKCKSTELMNNQEELEKRVFLLMPYNDFNYEISKSRIFQISSLEGMPKEGLEEADKHIFFSCLFNFESQLAVRSIGALLKFLDKQTIAHDIVTNASVVPICSVRPLELDQICFLDSETLKSLQIFNDIDYSYAYRHSPSRTSLNNKLDMSSLTLYGLYLSKMHTKVGIGKLRSFLMKPTRNWDMLKERHRVIDFFADSHNNELVGLVTAALKKCKFVESILKRMKETRCNLSEWKRIYKTTQSLLAICNLSRPLNQILNEKTTPLTYEANNNFESQSKPYLNSTFFSSRLVSSPTTSTSAITTSLYSTQLNDSRQNLFKRIFTCNYGPKFEYLINLFERTVNLKESLENNRCRICPNISEKLDEKKQIFARLPEFMSHIVKEEYEKYDLNSCNIMYIPQIGFLFVITGESFLKSSTASGMTGRNSSSIYDASENSIFMDTSEQEYTSLISDEIGKDLDKIRAEFEFLHELKFVFKSTDQYYYKNERMLNLDKQFGDISSDINDLEMEMMDKLQDEFVKYSHYYANMIDMCAELDTLLAFALVAKEFNYVKPTFESSINEQKNSFILVKEGRHPLVHPYGFNFVANDIQSGECIDNSSSSQKIKIITSPNASGKTIYLKQTGLIAYMAMIGSFVPATSANIGDIDRICTCINSSDNINEGQSTFSTDVQRIALALSSTTSKSLVLIDEFGKGTLAKDGQAILATIVNNWLQMNDGESPHVLVSTHFYEMFQRADLLFGENAKGLEYLTFDYQFEEDEEIEFKKPITFLYKLKKGLTNSSLAINIAKNVGLPDRVINRASELLKIFKENVDTDEDILNGTKDTESKFNLLRTEASNAKFGEYREDVKRLLELHLNVQKTLAADTEKSRFPDVESETRFAMNNFKAFMQYLKNKSREDTDPENPINKAKKKIASVSSRSSSKAKCELENNFNSDEENTDMKTKTSASSIRASSSASLTLSTRSLASKLASII